jgi:hypothetical protein
MALSRSAVFMRFPEAESLVVAVAEDLVAWGVAGVASVEAEVEGSSGGWEVEASVSVVPPFFFDASSVLVSPI